MTSTFCMCKISSFYWIPTPPPSSKKAKKKATREKSQAAFHPKAEGSHPNSIKEVVLHNKIILTKKQDKVNYSFVTIAKESSESSLCDLMKAFISSNVTVSIFLSCALEKPSGLP